MILILSHNFIHTLNGSFSFGDLRALDLSSKGLASIPEMALSGLRMKTLLLAHNQLQDLSAFAHVAFYRLGCDRCDGSATFDLSDNSVRDLTPLLGTTWSSGPSQFAKLTLTGNPLDCTAQGSNLQALNADGVTIIGCP